MLIVSTSLQVQFKWYLDDLQTFDGVTNTITNAITITITI